MKLINDDFKDYFESKHKDKESREPVVYGETPEEREERELKESTIERRHNKMRIFSFVLAAFILLLLLFWLWSRYCHVYRTSSEKGVVMKMSTEGMLFKTYEGKMMSLKAIDASHIYETDFLFTVEDDSVATHLRKLAGTGRPVELQYKEYKGKLPWRGETNIVVTAVDTSAIHFSAPVPEHANSPKQQ